MKKRIFLAMTALAMAATSFAQEYMVVENHFGQTVRFNINAIKQVYFQTYETHGNGTADNPYNVAAIIKQTASLNDGEFLNDSADVYVTGIVTEAIDISPKYGNATYYISDNAQGSNRFYVYRGTMLNGAAVVSETDIEIGDSVTICGKIKNYKGTNEFDRGNYLTFIKKGNGGSVTPSTPGTVTAPLTVAQALDYIEALGADVQSPEGYVKGKIAAISDLSIQYGNATYAISDDGSEENTLIVYRGYSLGGAKFTSEDEIKVGDEVIIMGKYVYYKGNTKEMVQGSTIYSLNGKTAGGGTSSEGVKIVTIAQFNAAEVSNNVWYQLTGNIANLKDGDQYGNFDLVDATDSVYVYGLLSEKGGAKKKFQELVAAKGIKEGSKITIIGTRGEYNGKIEVLNAYFISIDDNSGSGNETPSGDKGSSIDNPYNIAEALAAINALADNGYSDKEVYVKGKVVKVTTNQTNFEKYGNLNYLISEDGSESNTITVYSGDGLNGAKFSGIDALSAGDEVIVYGKLQKYVKNDKVTPEIAKGNYLVALTKAGNNGGNDTPSSSTGTFESPLTASQAYDIVAAMEKGVISDADYYVKGKITSIKYTFSAQYGTATFNFSDDGNASDKEFIAYSTYYFGSEKMWVEGNTQVQVGDEVIVCGKVVNYNGNTPEFASKKSYVVKINSQTSASRRK